MNTAVRHAEAAESATRSYVLNAAFHVLREVHWTVAVTGVTSGKAWVLKSYETAMVRSQYLTMMRPLWVVEYKYRHVNYDDREEASFDAVMQRDKRRCCYCGGRATTIDHVMPASRGGLNTWRNLVAACVPCNQRKADRLPEEAGMRLLWTPDKVDPLAKVQRDVWRYVDEMSDAEYADVMSKNFSEGG